MSDQDLLMGDMHTEVSRRKNLDSCDYYYYIYYYYKSRPTYQVEKN